MSTNKGNYKGHQFHGDPMRFEILADYIYSNYGKSVRYIADVAGGQGMLARILNKKFNYEAEVIDPRGYTLVGVPCRSEEYTSDMASYYDLIIGLHPDEATRPVVESALVRPTIIIPCCNFWDRTKKLGREALLVEISKYYDVHKIKHKKITFDFKTSKNIGFDTKPRL